MAFNKDKVKSIIRIKNYNIVPNKNSQYKLFKDWTIRCERLYNNVVYIINRIEEGNFEMILRYMKYGAVKVNVVNGKAYYNPIISRIFVALTHESKKPELICDERQELKHRLDLGAVGSLTVMCLTQQIEEAYKRVLDARKSWKPKLKKYKVDVKTGQQIPIFTKRPSLKYIDRDSGNVVTFPIYHKNGNFNKKTGKALYTTGIRIENETLYFKKQGKNKITLENIKLDLDPNCYRTISLVPRSGYIKVCISYEANTADASSSIRSEEEKSNEDVYLGIDLGECIFASIASSDGKIAKLIKGGKAKFANASFNKQRSRLKSIYDKRNNKEPDKQKWIKSSHKLDKLSMKRDNRMWTFMHQASAYVLKLMQDNNIKTCIIGHNKHWNTGKGKLKKKDRKVMRQIPYNSFIQKLEYKLQDAGLKLIVAEESYTSKSSALVNDPLPKLSELTAEEREEIRKEFGKRRKRRGLFKEERLNLAIHADINAALNIIRKEIKLEYDLNKMSKNIFQPQVVDIGI